MESKKEEGRWFVHGRDIRLLNYYDPFHSCDYYMKETMLTLEKGSIQDEGNAIIQVMEGRDREAEDASCMHLASLLLRSIEDQQKKDKQPQCFLSPMVAEEDSPKKKKRKETSIFCCGYQPFLVPSNLKRKQMRFVPY